MSAHWQIIATEMDVGCDCSIVGGATRLNGSPWALGPVTPALGDIVEFTTDPEILAALSQTGEGE